jgi:hypothetical protein
MLVRLLDRTVLEAICDEAGSVLESTVLKIVNHL